MLSWTKLAVGRFIQYTISALAMLLLVGLSISRAHANGAAFLESYLDPSNPKVVFAVFDSASPGGVYLLQSHDGGQTWAKVAGPDGSAVRKYGQQDVTDFFVRVGPKPNVRLIITYSAVHKLWRAGPDLQWQRFAAPGGFMFDQLVSLPHPDRFFTIVRKSEEAEGRSSTLFRTETGGASWARVRDLLPFTCDILVNICEIRTSSDGKVLIGEGFVSRDGGTTWKDIAPDEQVQTVAAIETAGPRAWPIEGTVAQVAAALRALSKSMEAGQLSKQSMPETKVTREETSPKGERATGPNAQFIEALKELETALFAKIDSDVETTARAFWDAYDIQRSRRVADFVLAPLTVIEQTIGVMSFGKSAPDVLSGMERAENLIQVVSLLMGLSQLRQVGERLQTALDGPTYSSVVKETLKEAGASSQPGEYATTVKLYLYGIGGRRSPIGVSLQIGSADGASREVVWGAEAVKRRVSDRIKTLIQELAESPVATGVQADTMRMHVATLTEALRRSRADNVTVAPALVSTTTGAPPDLVLGSIGALEQVRREVLAQYDNDLRLEQISVLTSALKAGTQVISLRVGYKTPGGQLLKEVQRDVITPGAVLVNTLTKTYATGSRYQVAALPHEMVLSLPGELATSWKLVDEVVAAIRSLTSARVVTAGSNVQEASPMSQPVYTQPTPPDFVTKTVIDPDTQVRFSLKRKYIQKMGKKWFTFETVEVDPCRWHPGGSVFQPYYVFGEVPATVNLADDATARLLLERGKAYAVEQCGKGNKDDVVIRLYQSAFDEKNWQSEWAVFGRYSDNVISRKEELQYENKPLKQAERRRQEEEKRQRAEEEQRRRQAEAAAKQARLQEIEALRRSGPKALSALVQALGDKDAEVRRKAADALREVATAGFSELGVEAKDAIPALTEASKKGDLAARYALRRIKFPSSPRDSCRDELSQGIGGLIASERARPCPVEGDEEKKAAADQLNVAFTRRYGVQSVACEALSRNPFAYEGKVVALNVTFEQMIARDRGLFGVGDVFGGCGVTVSGIPQGVFSTRRVNVVLAGRVLGNTEVKIGPATLQVPHLQYVGVHICNEGDCADFFGPASMR